MAAGSRRAASRRHQPPDARRLRCRDRGRTGVDQSARLDLSAARHRRRRLQPRRHAGVRRDLRRRAAPQRYQQHPLDHPRPVRADASAQANGDVDARPWCQGFYAAMRLRISAWAPLLDTRNVNHGLLLPILMHCDDDQGRPLLGPHETRPARPSNSCATPTSIFQRPSRPCASTGCRSATPALANDCLRGSSCRLRSVPSMLC